MRYINIILVCTFSLVILACSIEEPIPDRKGDQIQLDKQMDEIIAMAESMSCNNSSNWKYIAVGAKACGGPTDYIAYSTAIDTTEFYYKIEKHKQDQKEFNAKWGVISDCSIIAEPADVLCDYGLPVLIYIDDINMTRQEHLSLLKNLFNELVYLSMSVSCDNSAEWSYTEYGSNACGGPQGYIAYPTAIETAFLEKVNDYRIAEKYFNKKWGIISICIVPNTPSGIQCENGIATLIY